jgi:nucleotide-binding universal stress UspA family protein
MFKTILLPIDLQHASSWEQALPVARQLLDPDGKLHLLGIVHDVGNAWVASYLPRGYEKRALEEMKTQLGAFVARELPGVTNVVTHVGHGHVAETVVAMAEKVHADLIVLAANAPDELRTFRISASADRVVRHSPVSVMIVR